MNFRNRASLVEKFLSHLAIRKTEKKISARNWVTLAQNTKLRGDGLFKKASLKFTFDCVDGWLVHSTDATLPVSLSLFPSFLSFSLWLLDANLSVSLSFSPFPFISLFQSLALGRNSPLSFSYKLGWYGFQNKKLLSSPLSNAKRPTMRPQREETFIPPLKSAIRRFSRIN